MLVLAITEDLDKLLENGGMTSMAPLCKLGRIVEMAVDLALVFIVGVLCTEDRWAHGAGEMLNVVLAIQGCNVGATESTTTLVAQKVQSPEIVRLAEGKLAGSVIRVNGEELGGNNFTTILWKRWCESYGISKNGKGTGGEERGGLCARKDTTYLALETLQVECATQCAHKLPR